MKLEDNPEYQELFDVWDETIYSEAAFYVWYVLQVVLFSIIEAIKF